jgi:mannosyl-3-phosphoglycerate phosphatase
MIPALRIGRRPDTTARWRAVGCRLRPMPELNIVVFSNVDAVLDHSGRDAFPAAARALKPLERDRIPVVLCSSKTRAEIEVVQQALGIHDPFVCESGSAAFVPAGYFTFDVTDAREVAGYQAIELGRPYADVLQALRRAASRQKTEVIGFADMSVEEVARDCQLSLLQARLAKLREYSERFRLVDPSPAAHQRLFKSLEGAHLRCLSGQRYHQAGAAVDTSLAPSLLYALFRRAFGAVLSVGASDATAPFAEPPAGGPMRVHGYGTRLVDWATALVSVVEKLRAQESQPAR